MKNQLKNYRKGGRKKLSGNQLKTKKLQLHVTEQEFMEIQDLYQHSGKKTLSDFMRVLVLNKKKNNSIRNNVELISHLDGIGSELSRIGNNINQLAKYAISRYFQAKWIEGQWTNLQLKRSNILRRGANWPKPIVL